MGGGGGGGSPPGRDHIYIYIIVLTPSIIIPTHWRQLDQHN